MTVSMKHKPKKAIATDDKLKQLQTHIVDDRGATLTSDQGIAIRDNQNSLKAGSRGPSLLEDFLLREKITHFDHERIPERVVHARGAAAHGYFEPYESLAELTTADFLQDPSKRTPVFVRISTVAGSRGSADTVRDVRGFAIKFYTQAGNFDIVGNNMPVFFIQDAIKFPDFVHAVKPEPHNEIPQAQSAHDTFWDFVSLNTESLHMIMWVMSDRALPRSFAMMEGFGVHTFRLIDAEGRSRFIKWHWKPKLGVHSMAWDEMQKIAGKDPDFNRRDLWDSIEAGNFPEWELGIQIVEEADADKFDFDLLDATKLIPEELVPVRPIGRLVLNRNPDNYFAETEQVAFHLGNMVPGIDFSNDPLLQGRLFSYLDTQLLRLGGPNFAQIPINRPVVPVHTDQRDGFHQHRIHKGRTAYEPNSLGGGCPMQATEGPAFASYRERLKGEKVRERSASFADHFTQATLFYQSQSDAEQRHLVDALRFELSHVETPQIRQRVVALLANIDTDLAEKVALEIGVENCRTDISWLDQATTAPKPSSRRGAAKPGVSAALSMAGTRKDSIAGRKVAMLIAPGYDGAAAAAMQKALTAGGAMLVPVAPMMGPVVSDAGETMDAKFSLRTADSVLFDAVFLPGGADSIAVLETRIEVQQFLFDAFRHCKAIATTGDGLEILAASGIPVAISPDKMAGDAPIEALPDPALVISEDGSDDYIQRFVTAIAQHRHWDRELQFVPA